MIETRRGDEQGGFPSELFLSSSFIFLSFPGDYRGQRPLIVDLPSPSPPERERRENFVFFVFLFWAYSPWFSSDILLI